MTTTPKHSEARPNCPVQPDFNNNNHVPPWVSRDTGGSVDAAYHPVPPRMLLRRCSAREAWRHEGMLTATDTCTGAADGLS
jgi:hypothetical protein